MTRKPPPIPPPDHPSVQMQERIDRLVENSQPRAGRADEIPCGSHLCPNGDVVRPYPNAACSMCMPVRLGTDDLMARATVVEISADEHTSLLQDRALVARGRVIAKAVSSVLRRMADTLDGMFSK